MLKLCFVSVDVVGYGILISMAGYSCIVDSVSMEKLQLKIGGGGGLGPYF